MWTLTTEDIPTPKEFALRWNSLRANELSWLKGYLRFLEPQDRGAPHYHVLAAVEWDTKPAGFNWAAFRATTRQKGEPFGEFQQRRKTADWRAARAAYVQSAPEETRAMWKRLKTVLPKYGFGRSEFLPLRDPTGAAVYTGGYLRAGVQQRFGAWKGARLIEADRTTSQLWRKHGRCFSFNQSGERIWRHQLATWAAMVGCANTDEIAAKFGPKWCFHHRDRIMQIPAPSVEFTAINQDGKPMPPVNLRLYQLEGYQKHALAFAQANGWEYSEAFNYLYQRGTMFAQTALTNPAVREAETLLSSRARRLAREEQQPGNVYLHWKDGTPPVLNL